MVNIDRFFFLSERDLKKCKKKSLNTRISFYFKDAY